MKLISAIRNLHLEVYNTRSLLISLHLRILILALSLSIVLLTSPSAQAQKSLWHNSGKVAMLVSDWGILGKLDDKGILSFNFRYPLTDPESTFYMGPFSEIWLGDAKGNVASAFDIAPDGSIKVGEWMPTQTGTAKYVGDPNLRQEISSQCQIDPSSRFPFDINVDQDTYSWSASDKPQDAEFVIMKLTLTNRSAITADGIYLAICVDWDVDVLDPGGDLADWDAKRRAGFFYDSSGSIPTHVATVLFDGPIASYNIINRALWRFDDKLRSSLISNRETDTVQTIGKIAGNYMNVISVGPFALKGRIPATITFGFVAGKELKSLQTNIDRAKELILTPSQISAEVKANFIRLSWLPSLSPSVVGYKVYKSEKSGGDYQPADPRMLGFTNYEDKNIKSETKYYYMIKSFDILGNELASSAEIEVLPEPKIQPPRSLVALSEGNSIKLTWLMPEGEKALEYKLFRNESGKPPWTQIATVKATEATLTTFVDKNVFPKTRYFYAISSIGSLGEESSLSNPTVAAISQDTQEAKPTLEKVIAAPNPYNLSQDSGGIKFMNLTQKATIFIYSLNGELIRRLDHRDGRGFESWDLKNQNDMDVSSGIYIYKITAIDEGSKKLSATGKVAVIR